MALRVKLKSGEEIELSCRPDCKGCGVPTVFLGKYEIPEPEWIGLAIQHFKMKYDPNDIRAKWRHSLDQIDFKPYATTHYGWNYQLDVSDMYEKLSNMENTEPLVRSDFYLDKPGPDTFKYLDYELEPKEIVSATEYVLWARHYRSADDPRLDLVSVLIPNWNRFEVWKKATQSEEALTRKKHCYEEHPHRFSGGHLTNDVATAIPALWQKVGIFMVMCFAIATFSIMAFQVYTYHP